MKRRMFKCKRKSRNEIDRNLAYGFILVLMSFFILDVSAQTKNVVSGVVEDSNNLPLIGVAIKEEGTTNGTVTDIDGRFSLNVKSKSNLELSYIGYKKMIVNIDKKSDLGTIIMNEDDQTLKEVVVVGYGTLEKKQVTNSITSLSSKDLMEGVGGASVATALQGKVSGLVISGNDSPNGTNTFQLRGVASINSGQSPLVVIDGVPGGDIRSLVQEDIESIDILKDASAGAIYGTQAAAGVILITTKKAQNTEGKIKVSYRGEVIFKQSYNKPKVLSAEEYLAHGRGEDYGSSVNWYDELLNNNPTSQRQVINLSGGTKYSQLFATFLYENNKGLAINDNRTDYSGRINASFKILEGWVDINTHIDYRQAKRNRGWPNFQQALRNNPTRSPYDPDSETGYNVWLKNTLDYNVLADTKLQTDEGIDQWFKPDVTIKLNVLPIEGLFLQQTIGYDRRQWENHTYKSKYHREELENSRKGSAFLEFNKTENLNSEGYLTYIKEKGNHSINAVAGYSYYEHNSEKFNMKNFNFSVDDIKFWDMGQGTYLKDGTAEMDSEKSITERLFALFARVNYVYNDRYMGSATIRREGSSKFAINNRWGTFWALSGGWRISEENFMKNISQINDLKFRIGYGVTGNNDFDADYSRVMFGSDVDWMVPNIGGGYSWIKSYGKLRNVNNDLKWEEKTEWNFGIDYSLFDNRIYGKFDYYRRKVNGLIYEVQVPQPPYIEQKMFKNIGSLENKGWEFEIGADIVRSKDWNYSTTINLSNNQTKILNLDGSGSNTYFDKAEMPAPGSPGFAIRVQQNTKVGSFYLWKFAGFDEKGDFLLYNKNGEIIPAADKKQEDKRYIGNSTPTLIVGWNHSVRYKNWDMSVNIRSWIDFDVYNTIDMYFALPNDKQNTNVLKKAYSEYSHINGEKQLSDFFLDDGTFLKIDAINLGYNFNLRKYTNNILDRARCYFTVTNVATFTKYKGINPEVNITGLDGGIEWFTNLYPRTRGYTLGMQLSF